MRLAALRERDLDRVEVARDDRVREHLARLVADVAREVARGEMREREQPHLGGARDSAAWRAVEWPVSRARSCSSSRNVASCTSRSARWAKTSVAWQGAVSPEITIRRPRRGSPITCSGLHAVDGLAALEAAEVGAGLDPEPRGRLGVEAAGPVFSSNA